MQAPGGAKPSAITLVCELWMDVDCVTSPGSGPSQEVYFGEAEAQNDRRHEVAPILRTENDVPPSERVIEPWNQSSGC